MANLPTSGQGSTYSNFFVNKRTASGDIYTHDGYTAALLPRERWHAVPLGTRLRITVDGRSVVVNVNDRGTGDGTLGRVLDLSRAAYAYLVNRPSSLISDQSAGLVLLRLIEVVSADTPLGPVKP
ncbi:septal ring lytic transglycosylase RlpA family protein [Telmatospirillum sp.]|uniref:septal ring lytic transglycosylase RlpA family protein n=1 Tax=Telmatospirillum sp. TaxID=2079197 RepID=UPI0028426D76|nr:septal ring lytic transglycosylase RlpA family protein [Telmatospirillum sp.]MDR3439102.1 septal ring lytic transglycosylase RlpA family protein [Telmatospirillum sp.]